uniref:PKD_channel domain-containing protein n=1 Tax=Heterorhabditis bacteriophora TaxID=37862 RepID=A0A1I7WBB7_HETBA
MRRYMKFDQTENDKDDTLRLRLHVNHLKNELAHARKQIAQMMNLQHRGADTSQRIIIIYIDFFKYLDFIIIYELLFRLWPEPDYPDATSYYNCSSRQDVTNLIGRFSELFIRGRKEIMVALDKLPEFVGSEELQLKTILITNSTLNLYFRKTNAAEAIFTSRKFLYFIYLLNVSRTMLGPSTFLVILTACIATMELVQRKSVHEDDIDYNMQEVRININSCLATLYSACFLSLLFVLFSGINDEGERASVDQLSLTRFGKRVPMNRSAMVRFGRAPMDRSTMVRFGKRAALDRSSMVRFGKRSPMDRSSMVRFGKRAPMDRSSMVRQTHNLDLVNVLPWTGLQWSVLGNEKAISRSGLVYIYIYIYIYILYGYFLCQLSASYGNSSAPSGQKLNHMIDAIGAVGSFHISNGQVLFSSQYYPARPYKIWEFYDRNMSKASVPWAGWSNYNLTAMSRWEQVPVNPDSARFHPNLDFWKVGNRIVAGTEAPYWVGYEFDVLPDTSFKNHLFILNGVFTNSIKYYLKQNTVIISIFKQFKVFTRNFNDLITHQFTKIFEKISALNIFYKFSFLRLICHDFRFAETIAADFPQINHAYEQKPYQWAYIVEHPFAADNKIIKVYTFILQYCFQVLYSLDIVGVLLIVSKIKSK